MSQALVDELKAAYPEFRLKNKHNVARSLFLADGEEIVVPAHGTVKIKSVKINSFPDLATFHYESPKLEVLDEYGVLTRKSKPANAKLHEENTDSTESPLTPSPVDENNTPAVDGKAAGNQTVKSPTSPTIDGNANLESKSGSTTNKTGQR